MRRRLVFQPAQDRNRGWYQLNGTKTGISILLAVFVVTGVGMQLGALQTSMLACAFSDEVAYEGAQGCFDDPFENDNPASPASFPLREWDPLSRPIITYSLLSRLASIQNSHQLLTLRC